MKMKKSNFCLKTGRKIYKFRCQRSIEVSNTCEKLSKGLKIAWFEKKSMSSTLNYKCS